MKKIILFILCLILVGPLYAGHKKLARDDLIRVAIAHSISFADLNGDLIVKPISGGRENRIMAHAVRITPVPNGFAVNESAFNCKELSVDAASGLIKFNGHVYAGSLVLYKDAAGTLSVVNALPLEDYLAGLVGGEVPAGWPVEAIKAQSVASRTYALFQKDAKKQALMPYDLEATVLDQVYQGAGNLDERIKNAVLATSGEVLKKDGRYFKAFFSSTCGGQTESPINVWGEHGLFPLIVDPYCKRSPHNSWTYSISKQKLAGKLQAAGFPATTVSKIDLEHIEGNPRVATVIAETGGQTIYVRGSDFRRIVGFDSLKSTWFDAKIEGNNVVFTGRGYGHGVGLCQWGARGMAEEGKTYEEILQFYYPGARLEKIL